MRIAVRGENCPKVIGVWAGGSMILGPTLLTAREFDQAGSHRGSAGRFTFRAPGSSFCTST